MAHLTIHVPSEHVDQLRRELVRSHSERVATLWRTVAAYAHSHDGLDELEGLTVEICDLHAAIEQLGWEPRPAPTGVTVSAHPEVLADAIDNLIAGRPAADGALLGIALQIAEGR